MRISILDVLPIISGSDAGASLRRAGELARVGDELGFTRLWYAEHHGMESIASATPELLIGHAAAQTRRIRLGSGGVMLPNHVPLRVVEQYCTLEALYPDRIDLGIGRAAGTDPLTARALRSVSGHLFPQQMAELLAFSGGGFPDDHPFSRLSVTPGGTALPPIWILGSSGGSAELAGKIGAGYGFAGHFSPSPSAPAVRAYRQSFQPSERFASPQVILAVNVVCADTEAEATELASGMEMTLRDMARGQPHPIRAPAECRAAGWVPGMRERLGPMGRLMITGTLEQVAEAITAQTRAAGGVDEVMVMTIVHDAAARRRSYELLSQLIN